MRERSYNVREVERGIRKLTRLYSQDNSNGFDRRMNREKYGWYYVDGERKFCISSKLPPSGSVGKGRVRALRNDLRLSVDDFDRLCSCSLTGPQYHAIITAMTEVEEL